MKLTSTIPTHTPSPMTKYFTSVAKKRNLSKDRRRQARVDHYLTPLSHSCKRHVLVISLGIVNSIPSLRNQFTSKNLMGSLRAEIRKKLRKAKLGAGPRIHVMAMGPHGPTVVAQHHFHEKNASIAQAYARTSTEVSEWLPRDHTLSS